MSAQLVALSKAWQGVEASLQKLPLGVVKQGLVAALVVWLLYGFAQMSWLLLEEPAASNTAVVAAGVGTAPPQTPPVDIASLQALNLFGEANRQQQLAVPEVKLPEDGIEDQAGKTSLDIQLTGIVYSEQPELAVAIIVARGKVDQYHVGDKLPLGQRVTLAKVLLDRVIIDNSGRYESLWLFDETNKRISTRSNAKSTDQAKLQGSGSANATALARDYRSRLYKNPSSLAEAVRIAPAQENGVMVGYRVSPGRDREQFKAFGFEAGDIVTSINEVSLDDPSKALEVYKLMRSAREASFTVSRDGQSIDLVVSLDDSGSE